MAVNRELKLINAYRRLSPLELLKKAESVVDIIEFDVAVLCLRNKAVNITDRALAKRVYGLFEKILSGKYHSRPKCYAIQGLSSLARNHPEYRAPVLKRVMSLIRGRKMPVDVRKAAMDYAGRSGDTNEKFLEQLKRIATAWPLTRLVKGVPRTLQVYAKDIVDPKWRAKNIRARRK